AGELWVLADGPATEWTLDTAGVNGAAAAHDAFGSTLNFANFDRKGGMDLAIGVPGKSVGGHAAAGAVSVLHTTGTSRHLRAASRDLGNEATPGVPELAQAADHFGAALP